MRLKTTLTMIAALAASLAAAADIETPAAQPPATSLPSAWISGPDFYVRDPVEVDGLMPHYVVDSRFGEFPAYGRAALEIRIREVAALTQISKITDFGVVTNSVGRQVQSELKTVAQVVTHPVGTVIGIPTGIAHLFSGYKAQAGEFSEKAKKASQSNAPTTVSSAGREVKADAVRYADRYLGISAAERRYYKKLGVDPYTNNTVLRKAVHHLAKVEAATNFGMNFAGLPGLPYLSDVKRAMDAIYNEDPAVLRARRRATLAGYGLTPPEIERFESTLLLSPTRQSLLEQDARLLEGVAGRDELFRHAMSVTSEEEVQIFLQSTRLLAGLHAHRPVARIVSGLRLPTAQFEDGRVAVVGAFDSVYWTEEVAAYEATLHAALPADSNGLELWLSGRVSPLARNELTARGWEVDDNTADNLALPSP